MAVFLQRYDPAVFDPVLTDFQVLAEMNSCTGGNLYAGTLDIHGKPNGKGVLYYLESGECDVGTYNSDLKQTGAGVRFSRDRQQAFAIDNGNVKDAIPAMSAALDRVGLKEPPAMRHKDAIPTAFGYSEQRSEQVKAWYQFRNAANLSVTESCYGANKYLPETIREKK
eukprot:s243_g22.t1